MNKLKKFMIILLIIMLSIIVTGCWNYREINDLAIVSGLAIDKAKTEGNYLLTYEIINANNKGKESGIEPKLIEMEGKTIFDSVRNAIMLTGKKLYWSHVNIVIISEDIAKEGFLPIVDFINRDSEPREQINILVSKEKQAGDILRKDSITEDILSFEIYKKIKANDSYSKTINIQIHDVINLLAAEGESVVLPTIYIKEEKGKKIVELSGLAIFKKDRLVGFLNDEETKYYLFIKNKIKGGILTLKQDSKDSYDDISLEIDESNTKLRPEYINKKLKMFIDINTKVNLGEVGVEKDVIGKKGREILKKDIERKLELNIKKLIRRVQTEYGVDSFGFGNIIKKDDPELWKKIKDDWKDMYQKLDIIVNVKLEITNSGHMPKPIKVGD